MIQEQKISYRKWLLACRINLGHISYGKETRGIEKRKEDQQRRFWFDVAKASASSSLDSVGLQGGLECRLQYLLSSLRCIGDDATRRRDLLGRCNRIRQRLLDLVAFSWNARGVDALSGYRF